MNTSKVTNPLTEPNVTCGFFNSTEAGTRLYDASDFSKLFDGMITDGVFASVGDKFIVKADSGLTVNIGTGKCWFNQTWTANEETLPFICEAANDVLNRIDAIVLEVNTSTTVRDNCFKYIVGTPATNPTKPSLIKTDFVHQYAICYITRPKGSTEISQSNIENVVGTSQTPFVTAILQTVSVDELCLQWRSQLDEFIAERQTDVNNFITANETEYDESIAKKEDDADASIAKKEEEYDVWSGELRSLMDSLYSEAKQWYDNATATVDGYLSDIKDKLGDDPATSLQLQIDKNTIKDMLMNGFADGTKTISEDGLVVTSTNSSNWTLVNTFTDNSLTSTNVLTDNNGTELGKLVKHISSDGLTITSDFTIF